MDILESERLGVLSSWLPVMVGQSAGNLYAVLGHPRPAHCKRRHQKSLQNYQTRGAQDFDIKCCYRGNGHVTQDVNGR